MSHHPHRTFFADFDDIFVSRIARSEQTDTKFWGLLLDFAFTPVGGCQQEVKAGDHVLWAFGASDASVTVSQLRLAGPATAAPGFPVTFAVTDAANGAAIAGATVESSGAQPVNAMSDANGKARLSFTPKGEHSVKASKERWIRSNAVKVVVV